MKTFFGILAFILVLANIFALFIGLFFGADNRGPEPWTRRVHFVAPAYVLGYWLTQPIDPFEEIERR